MLNRKDRILADRLALIHDHFNTGVPIFITFAYTAGNENKLFAGSNYQFCLK